MNEKKVNDNIKAQPEVGALWEKEEFKTIRFFGRLDVEQVEELIKKAKKNGNSKINIIAYKIRKDDDSRVPDYRIVESKFNNNQGIGDRYE